MSKLGKKVLKVLRLGKKVVAVAGAVGGAALGLKHIHDVNAHSDERARTNAEDQSHLHKARATSRATVIMDGLDREHDAETRHRSSVISGAAAKGKSRVPVAPHFGRYVVKTHRKQKGETAMGRLQRINTMASDSRRRDAVRDEALRQDLGTRAKIAKAEEGLRLSKQKQKKRRSLRRR
jgi:hypothetical protein